MNKLKWLKALLLAFGFLGQAQAQEVRYSDYEKFDLRSGDFSVLGKTGGRLYTYRASSDGFFLDAHDDSLNKLATVVLDFFPKKVYETHFVSYPDRIVVMFQGLEGKTVTQYAALLDDMGRLVKGPMKLSEARTGFFGPNREYFSSAVSDNKSQIVVYGTNPSSDKLEFTAFWIDPNDLTVRTRKKTTYTSDNDLTVGDASVTNDGTVFLPVSTQLGSKSFADRLTVLRLAETDTRFKPLEIPLNDKYVSSYITKVDNANGRVYVGGFYSEKKTGNYDGVLFGYVNIADNTIQSRRMIAFDDRLRDATGDKNRKRAFNDFQVRQLIVKNDGGFVMMSENYYMTTRNAYTPGWGYYSSYYNYGPYGPYSAPSIREYHYGDVLALSYDGAGNREWHSFIRKDQYSQEDGGVFSSYALLNTGGSLGFLYNDFNRSHSTIQLATVGSTGEIQLRSFGGVGKNAPDWLPRSGKQTGAREMIIPCVNRRQICFAKVVF